MDIIKKLQEYSDSGDSRYIINHFVECRNNTEAILALFQNRNDAYIYLLCDEKDIVYLGITTQHARFTAHKAIKKFSRIFVYKIDYYKRYEIENAFLSLIKTKFNSCERSKYANCRECDYELYKTLVFAKRRIIRHGVDNEIARASIVSLEKSIKAVEKLRTNDMVKSNFKLPKQNFLNQ